MDKPLFHRNRALACAGLLSLAPALHATNGPSVAGPQAADSAANASVVPLAPRAWTTTGRLIQATPDEQRTMMTLWSTPALRSSSEPI